MGGEADGIFSREGLTRDYLLTSDFKTGVCLRLEDGSSVAFKHAFCLDDADLDEIAVFTEHCGYHVFPRIGTQIEVLEPGVDHKGRWLDEFFHSADKVEVHSDCERWSCAFEISLADAFAEFFKVVLKALLDSRVKKLYFCMRNHTYQGAGKSGFIKVATSPMVKQYITLARLCKLEIILLDIFSACNATKE